MKRLNIFFYLFLATFNMESHFDIGSFMTCEIELTNLKYTDNKHPVLNQKSMVLKNLHEKDNDRKLFLKLSNIKNTRVLEDNEEKESLPEDSQIQKKKNQGPNEFFLKIYCVQNGDNYDQKVQILINCGSQTSFIIKYPGDTKKYNLDNEVSENNPIGNLETFKYHNPEERNFIEFKPDKENCAIYVKFVMAFKAFGIVYFFTFF